MAMIHKPEPLEEALTLHQARSSQARTKCDGTARRSPGRSATANAGGRPIQYRCGATRSAIPGWISTRRGYGGGLGDRRRRVALGLGRVRDASILGPQPELSWPFPPACASCRMGLYPFEHLVF